MKMLYAKITHNLFKWEFALIYHHSAFKLKRAYPTLCKGLWAIKVFDGWEIIGEEAIKRNPFVWIFKN